MLRIALGSAAALAFAVPAAGAGETLLYADDFTTNIAPDNGLGAGRQLKLSEN